MKQLIARLKPGPIAFSLALVAALALIFVSEGTYHASVDSVERLDELSATRASHNLLLRQLLDAESGQRGYLITGRPEYLGPYRKSMTQIADTLKALNEFYAQNPDQVKRFTELAKLVSDKVSEMDTMVQLRTDGRDDAWHALIETDIGREQMEAIRLTAEELIAHETTQIATTRESIFNTVLLSRVSVNALTVISIIAFFMYLRQLSILDRERRRQKTLLMAERDMLEAQAQARTRQLTELAQHLQTAREDERSRLARDLHDELGALLTAAKLDVARLKSRLGTLAPEISERLAHLNEALNSGIALKRRIIENLRPSSLTNLGLEASLEILAREFGDTSGIRMTCELEGVSLQPSTQLTVYRMVQEALTNAAKHAKATEITIHLRTNDQKNAVVSVSDNGVGFDKRQTRPSTHGLLGMQYRIEAEGGTVDLETAPGRGTRIRATFPLHIPG